MKLYFGTYRDNELVITNVFNTLLKDHQIECELRHVSEPVGLRNLENELDADIVRTLSDVTVANTDIVERYFTLKARLMHTPKLSLADIYAPIHATPPVHVVRGEGHRPRRLRPLRPACRRHHPGVL